MVNWRGALMPFGNTHGTRRPTTPGYKSGRQDSNLRALAPRGSGSQPKNCVKMPAFSVAYVTECLSQFALVALSFIASRRFLCNSSATLSMTTRRFAVECACGEKGGPRAAVSPIVGTSASRFPAAQETHCHVFHETDRNASGKFDRDVTRPSLIVELAG